tara:strand:- start:2324 stop:3529 length:1206 start_codon:yes stop_codon:yes gene_type:complete
VKTKIVILTSYFCGWNGGIDLINFFIKSISKNKEYDLIICIPKNNFKSEVKKTFFPILQIFKSILSLDFKRDFYWKFHKGADQVEKFLLKNLKDKTYKIKYIDFTDEIDFIEQVKPEIVFPILKCHDINTNVGYIFDFQHEYYPKNFSKKHVLLRRKEVSELSKLKYFIVNSKQTKRDLLKFHSEFKRKKIRVVPFTPFMQKKYFLGDFNTSKIYSSKTGFFIICNQFWKHKNHLHIIKLFKKYFKNGGKNNLILTGDITYERFKDYIAELFYELEDENLKDRIFLTGNIKKQAQICLIKKSSALIQPSLFEGGPGAGGVAEASILGVPIIANNIPINKEIKYKKLRFYKNDKQFIHFLFQYEKHKNKVFKKNYAVTRLNSNLEKSSKFFFKSFKEFLNLA